MIDDVIQTDAALNPGNTGGALAEAAAASSGSTPRWPASASGPRCRSTPPPAVVAALNRDGRVRRAWTGIAGEARPLPARCSASGRDRAVEVVEVSRARRPPAPASNRGPIVGGRRGPGPRRQRSSAADDRRAHRQRVTLDVVRDGVADRRARPARARQPPYPSRAVLARLAFLAVLAAAGCGGDDPAQTAAPTRRRRRTRRPKPRPASPEAPRTPSSDRSRSTRGRHADDRHRPRAVPCDRGEKAEHVVGELRTPDGAGPVSSNLVVRYAGPGELLASGHPEGGGRRCRRTSG